MCVCVCVCVCVCALMCLSMHECVCTNAQAISASLKYLFYTFYIKHLFFIK